MSVITDFGTVLAHFPCLEDAFGVIWALRRSLGEALGPYLRPERNKLRKVSNIGSQYGRLWAAWCPLRALGCFSADPECKKSVQKCPKDHLGGIVKIVIFLYVFAFL